MLTQLQASYTPDELRAIPGLVDSLPVSLGISEVLEQYRQEYNLIRVDEQVSCFGTLRAQDILLDSSLPVATMWREAMPRILEIACNTEVPFVVFDLWAAGQDSCNSNCIEYVFNACRALSALGIRCGVVGLEGRHTCPYDMAAVAARN